MTSETLTERNVGDELTLVETLHGVKHGLGLLQRRAVHRATARRSSDAVHQGDSAVSGAVSERGRVETQQRPHSDVTGNVDVAGRGGATGGWAGTRGVGVGVGGGEEGEEGEEECGRHHLT